MCQTSLYCTLGSAIELTCIISSPGDVAGQLTPPSPTCPGDMFTFICNVTGNMSGKTTWRVGGSSECNALTHRAPSSSSPCGLSNAFIARPGAGFGTNGPFFKSTLSGTAIPALDGTLVECFGPANSVDPDNRVGGSTLQIVGQYITAQCAGAVMCSCITLPCYHS